MRVVTTLAEIKEELKKVRAAATVSDAARRRQFTTFRMDPPADLPPDPDCAAYRNRQLALYEEITGRPYAIGNERTHFDVAAMADTPFPYLNQGWEVTGDQLIAVGWLFKLMQLPPGASVLEFGPGWGNTTLALAQNGYRVTGVEIEPNFIGLIAERARRLHVAVELLQGDFLDAARLDQRFDAILFFESFHHCADHHALFDLLPRLVAPGGIVVFCAEPIEEGFPAPWGLRLDGQSLWAIRANGWLELGFTESYVVANLMRRGFVVDLAQSDISPLTRAFVARVAAGHYAMATFRMAPAEDRTWAVAESDPALHQRFTSHESVITLQSGGPFARIEVAARNFAPLDLPVEVTFGGERVRQVVPAHAQQVLTLPYDAAGTTLTVRTRTWCPAEHPGMGGDGRVLGLAILTVDLL